MTDMEGPQVTSTLYVHQKHLEEVVNCIANFPTRPQLIEISGLPGIGKGSFVHRLAEMLEKSPSTGRTCNIDLQKGDTYQNVMAKLLKIITIYDHDTEGYEESNGEELVQELSMLNPNDQLHIVVCGINRILEKEQAKLLTFLENLVESSSSINVFMTTRTLCNFPRLHDRFYQYILQPLTLHEAKAYLKLFVDAEFYWTYVVDKIITRSGGHPKLLEKIGYLLKISVKPSDIWTLIEDNPFDLLQEEGLRGSLTELVDGSMHQLTGLDLSEMLIIEGTFGLPAYTAITGRSKSSTALVKFNICQELSRHTLTTVDRGQSFVINRLVKFLVQQRWGHKLGEVQSHNNFCLFYGKLLQQLTCLLQTHHRAYLPAFVNELGNMQVLMRRATYAIEEDYDLFMSIGDLSQDFIFDYLQHIEVVSFYECCVASARRKQDNHYLARMLVGLSHAVMTLTNDFAMVGCYLQEAQDLYDRIGERESVGCVRLFMANAWFEYLQGKSQKAIKLLVHFIII